MSTTSLPKTERGLLVAAVRQLLADGWNLDRMRSADGTLALHYDTRGQDATPMVAIDDYVRSVQHMVYPESIAQAMTFLVAAGVLPQNFAFWTPPLPSRPAHDPCTCDFCQLPDVEEVRARWRELAVAPLDGTVQS